MFDESVRDEPLKQLATLFRGYVMRGKSGVEARSESVELSQCLFPIRRPEDLTALDAYDELAVFSVGQMKIGGNE